MRVYNHWEGAHISVDTRQAQRALRQIVRAFRIPTRLLIGSMPAKAAHKRRYGRG